MLLSIASFNEEELRVSGRWVKPSWGKQTITCLLAIESRSFGSSFVWNIAFLEKCVDPSGSTRYSMQSKRNVERAVSVQLGLQCHFEYHQSKDG